MEVKVEVVVVVVVVVVEVVEVGSWVGILCLLSPTVRKRQESFKCKGLCQESRDCGK